MVLVKEAKATKAVYVSGPMTGIKDNNTPLFNFYTKKLRAKGYAVVNPAEMDAALTVKDLTWEKCIVRDLKTICEMVQTYGAENVSIGLLPNAFKSRGARKEISTFWDLGVDIVDINDLLKRRG